tara:strand:- start:1878 stop:3302 length:1425 start_codon:yes stop_codon:yes gene_type:complete
MKFSELEELMNEKGIVSLADLARSLDTTPQAVSNWKSRDHVPYHIENKISLNKNVDASSQPIIIDDNQNHSFSDILLVLASQSKIIVFFTLISVFLTFTYTKLIKIPKYASISKILVPETKMPGLGGGLSGLASQFGVSVPNENKSDLSSPSLLPEIIRSRTFAEKILEKEFYTEEMGKKLKLLNIISAKEVIQKSYYSRELDKAISKLQYEYISLTKNELTGVSTIKVITKEPKFSNDLAKSVLSELELLNKFFKKQISSEKILYINNRINSLQKELSKSENSLLKFKEENRQVSSPSLQLEQRKMESEVEVQRSVFLTLKQQLELAKIDEIESTSVLQILDYPSIPVTPISNNLLLSLVVSIIFGLIISLIVAFTKSYFETDDLEERKKIRRIKRYFRKKSFEFLNDKRITGSLSFLLIIFYPYYLRYQSENPIFFNKFSSSMLVIIILYTLFLIASVSFYIKSKFFKKAQS